MGTQGDQPSDQTPKGATDPKDEPTATPKSDEDVVSIPKKDLNNLISQRDANFSKAKSTEEKLDQALSWQEQQEEVKARKAYVKDFLGENSEDYPDVKAGDLLHATTPEDVKEIADRVQQIHIDANANALSKIQAGDDDSLTEEEITKETDKLDPTKQPDAFEKMVNLQLRRK